MSATRYEIIVLGLLCFISGRIAADDNDFISAAIYWRAIDTDTISYTIESTWRASKFNINQNDVYNRVIGGLIKFQVDTRLKDTIMVAGKVVGLLDRSDIFMAKSTISVTYSQSGLVTVAALELGLELSSVTATAVVGTLVSKSFQASLPPKITVCDSRINELHIATIPPPNSISSYTVFKGAKSVSDPINIAPGSSSIAVSLQETTPEFLTIRFFSTNKATGVSTYIDIIFQVWVDTTCHGRSKDSVPLYNLLPTSFIIWTAESTTFIIQQPTGLSMFPSVKNLSWTDSRLVYTSSQSSDHLVCAIATTDLITTDAWACSVAIPLARPQNSVQIDIPSVTVNSLISFGFSGSKATSSYQIFVVDSRQVIALMSEATRDSGVGSNYFSSQLRAPSAPALYFVIIRDVDTLEIFGLGTWNVVGTDINIPGTSNPLSPLVQVLQEPAGPITITSVAMSPISVMDKPFHVIVYARDINGNMITSSGGVVLITLAEVLFFGSLNSGMANVSISPSSLGTQAFTVTLPYSNSPILRSTLNVIPLPSEPFIGSSTIILAPDTVRIGETAVLEWIAHTTSGSTFTNVTSFRFLTSMESANASTIVIDSGVFVCNTSTPNKFCVSWIALKVGLIRIQIRNDPRDRIFYTKNVTVTPGDIVLSQTTISGSGTLSYAYVGDVLELFMVARDRYGNLVPPSNSSLQNFQVEIMFGSRRIDSSVPIWNDELKAWKSQYVASSQGTMSTTIRLNGAIVYIRNISVLARNPDVSVQWIWIPVSFSIAGLIAAGYAHNRRKGKVNLAEGVDQGTKNGQFASEFAFVNQTGIMTNNSDQGLTSGTGALSDTTSSTIVASSETNQASLLSDDISIPEAAQPSMDDLPLRPTGGYSSGEAMIEINSSSDESVKLVPIRNGIEWRPTQKGRSRFLIKPDRNISGQSTLSSDSDGARHLLKPIGNSKPVQR